MHDDPAWVEQNVRDLTGRHEAGRPQSWSVDDAPPQFIEGLLRAIVGVELLITRIEAKFKLSQNQTAADVDGVISGLITNGHETPPKRCSERDGHEIDCALMTPRTHLPNSRCRVT